MNQAIQQMLSRRAQLAALMVVAALVAAALVALSPVRAAAGDVDKDEVSLQLLVYFPDDSDGVFPLRTGAGTSGDDRINVAVELRLTVPYEAATAGATAVIPDTDFGLNLASNAFAVAPFAAADAIYPPDTAPTAANRLVTTGAGSSLSLSGGLEFNDPQNTRLFFANDGARVAGPPVMGDDADVVLDCSGAATKETGSANPDGNRLRTDQTADGKPVVVHSCHVKVRTGDGDFANPQIFLQGARNGQSYTVSANLSLTAANAAAGNIISATWGDGDTTALQKSWGGNLSGSTTLRIDNGENEVASSALSLATNNASGSPCGSAAADAGKSCPAAISDRGSNTETTLNLSITNSEGAASNWGGIAEIQVQTTRGDIRAGSNPATSSDDLTRQCFDARICRWTITDNANDPWGTGVRANAIPIVLQAVRGETGTARVTAIVRKRGAGGYLSPDDDDVIEIKITGPATGFSMTAPTSTVHYAETTVAGDNRDQVKFGASATDASGETVTLSATRTNWRVTNSAGQNKTSDFKMAGSALSITRGVITLEVEADDTAAARLAPGVYTFKASIGGSSALEDTAQFTVAGPAADDGVTLTADPARPAGRLTNVTLAVTVNDAAGNPVADGTDVSIALSPAGGGTASLHDPTRGATLKTKNGMVSRDVVVVTGGTTVVTATAGGKVDTLLVTASAEAVEETHDITGLTRLSGFSGWTPTNDTTAGQLFASLATRGVGILWKWDPASEGWSRYAEADGQPLPGANDNFAIARGDILYIGGTN